MAFCTQCGKAATEDAKFCSACGSSLNDETVSTLATNLTSVEAVNSDVIPVIERDPSIVPLNREVRFRLKNYDGRHASHAKSENGNFLSLNPGGFWEVQFPTSKDPNVLDKISGDVARYLLDVTEIDARSCHVTVTDVDDPTVRFGFDMPKNSANEIRAAIQSLRQSYLVANPSAFRAHRLNCPHCQGIGTVTVATVTKKKGVSTGKATAALLTGGISLIGTGLAKKGEVSQLTCGACGISWEVS
jgi:hypothetical protein